MHFILLSWIWFISQAIPSVVQPQIQDPLNAKKSPSRDFQESLLPQDMGKEIPFRGKIILFFV
jgi:hypothetical protein